MQVKITSKKLLRLSSIIKLALKIHHMVLFWLIATEIIMDTVFNVNGFVSIYFKNFSLYQLSQNYSEDRTQYWIW